MKSEQTNSHPPSREDVHKMFDRIAPRYDLLNRLLSFGRDVSWRKKVAHYLPHKDQLALLDVATGTGDLLVSLYSRSGRVATGVGMDLAVKMLSIAQKKIAAKNLGKILSVTIGDARTIPFGDGTFDAVTIAFGIRNVDPVEKALAEMYRVLSPGGKALILEFSLPENILMRKLYLLYFRYILPIIGAFISGDSYAYRYLNRTVETFPYGDDFCSLMKQAGFENVIGHRLTFGVATIYEGAHV
ncbi:MAG: bifunctional demethylmenaquinone methyltransferase/2-methoxy-6-polyprenyl-1,4-benzoquinol methylase UbiE [Candidatus Zixiibacteriota bacterium]